MSIERNSLKWFFKTGIFLFLVLGWSWGGAAIFLNCSEPGWLKILCVTSFVALLPGVFFFCRSFFKAVLACLVFFMVLLFWWNSLQPSNNKDWALDVAKISHGEIIGDRLTMHNVRDFRYTDEDTFQEHWQTREYDLKKLQGLDIFLSYWASDDIAHLITSWDFGDDGHMAVSIETRKDKTQKYSAVKGFLKQYELSYVAADERDIVGLRTNFRKERVYFYRLVTPKGLPRALLEEYLLEMNRLVTTPEFYNAFSRNCATTANRHVETITKDGRFFPDWRLILSGHLDELLYEEGSLQNYTLSLAKLRQKSRIDLQMQKYDGDNFSKRLRELVVDSF